MVGRKLQDLWLAFAKDPERGLKNADWETYEAGKGLLIGGGNSAVKEVDISQVDGLCDM